MVLGAVCALIVLSPVFGFAQEQTPKEVQWEFGVDAYSIISSAISGDIPLYLYCEGTFFQHIAYSLFTAIQYSTGQNEWSFESGVEVDWHPFDKGLDGFFLGVAVLGSIDKLSITSKAQTLFLGFAPTGGYQFLLPWNIDIDLALGVPVGLIDEIDSGGHGSLALGYLSPLLKIGLGYRLAATTMPAQAADNIQTEKAVKEPQNAISWDLGETGHSLDNAPSGATAVVPIMLDYQRVLADHFVLLVAPSILYTQYPSQTWLNYDQIVEVDWHPFDRGIEGLSIGAYLDIDYGTYISGAANILEAGVGAAIGYEITFGNFLMEFAVGLGIGEGYTGGQSPATPGWAVYYPGRADVGLGWRF